MVHKSLAPLRYSIAQAAQLLQLSRATLYGRIQEGRLSVQKDGRRTFITAAELARYLRLLARAAPAQLSPCVAQSHRDDSAP
jgi:excisionase family DNA binding protein